MLPAGVVLRKSVPEFRQQFVSTGRSHHHKVEYLPLKAVEKECIGLKLRPGSGSCVVFSCAIARPAVELEEHWFKDVVASVLLSERALLPQDTVARFRSDGTGQVHQYPVSCDML